ncbi:MAG: tail fiber protein [Calditrichaeota bacterium]|nr:MAG: tail fiber protein [Calditrichota bacterium]
MGARVGNYSRNMFDERNRYLQSLVQQGIPWVDADDNDYRDIVLTLYRRQNQVIIGNASPNDGFKIVGTGLNNDFVIKGGDGTPDGSGRIFVEGYMPFLLSDITYKGTPAAGLAGEDQRSIHSKITAISYSSISNETTITDTSANYVPNELVGRDLVVNIENGNAFPIVSNTSTQIVVSGDATAATGTGGGDVGTRYRIELSTPTAARVDGVYLNVYLDEIDSNEDTNLKHSLGSNTVEAQIRSRLEHSIFVREDITTYGEFTNYVDSDGNQHYVLKIATINRTATAAITSSMVSDLRKSYTTGGLAIPVGTILAFANTAPPGFLLCDGSLKLVNDYPDLASYLGTTYGGDGVNNFGLPNLKGRAIFGVDPADTLFDTIGKTGGSTTKDISHAHNISLATDIAGAHNHGGATGITSSFITPNHDPQFPFTTVDTAHTHPISTDGDHSHNVNGLTATSGSTTQDVVNPYIALNYYIKF